MLLLGSLFAAGLLSWASASRQLSGLEAVLLQVFTLGFGFVASFIFGQASAEQAGREVFRSHARLAFRRVISLYRSLSRLAAIIASDMDASDENSAGRAALEKLEAIEVEQIATAGDAVSDWRDICPEDVEELLQRTSVDTEANDA